MARPDAVVLREGYEQLRARVLAGHPDGWRLGHALLARRGVAGWIAEQTGGPVPGGPAARAGGAVPVPTADCAEIVAVLAAMALAHAA